MKTIKLPTSSALCLFPGLLLAGEDVAGLDEKKMRLSVTEEHPGVFRLEAQHAPWKLVFDEIANKTGARIHYPPPPQATVTVECAEKPLPRLIECLLGPDTDMIFRAANGSQATGLMDSTAEIWILNTSFGMDSSKASAAVDCQQGEAQQNPARCAPLATSSAESAQNIAEKTDQLLKITHTADAALRAAAIASLASEDQIEDAIIREVLTAALADENPDVRAQALFSLTQRQGNDAAAALQEALQDSDAAVRLMAVDIAENDAALLQQALADSDETVRLLAAMKLEQLSKTSIAE